MPAATCGSSPRGASRHPHPHPPPPRRTPLPVDRATSSAPASQATAPRHRSARSASRSEPRRATLSCPSLPASRHRCRPCRCRPSALFMDRPPRRRRTEGDGMHKASASKVTAAAAAAAFLVAGCSSGGFNGIYSLPLPGGASLGSHPYTVTAQFANVVDLVPQSAVRVNDVAVGRVSRIYLPAHSWTASVTMIINGDVHLPANADAEVLQSSLLGEEYIALSAPPGGIAEGRLADHAMIPLSRTTGNATVEEVLGALSLLLNGGGISQLHTITVQLNDALKGNEPQVRSLLGEISQLTGNLNAHRGDITSALDGLNQLGATLRANNQQIGNVLTNLGPGLQ